MLELNKLYLMDCMDGMKQFPDKYFELAVVDPPYGIDKGFSPTSRIRKYGQTRTANDDKPSAEYFVQSFGVTIIYPTCCQAAKNSYSGINISLYQVILTEN